MKLCARRLDFVRPPPTTAWGHLISINEERVSLSPGGGEGATNVSTAAAAKMRAQILLTCTEIFRLPPEDGLPSSDGALPGEVAVLQVFCGRGHPNVSCPLPLLPEREGCRRTGTSAAYPAAHTGSNFQNQTLGFPYRTSRRMAALLKSTRRADNFPCITRPSECLPELSV